MRSDEFISIQIIESLITIGCVTDAGKFGAVDYEGLTVHNCEHK
jgi:hypothetical protein